MDNSTEGKKVIIVGCGNNSYIAAKKIRELGSEVIVVDSIKDIPKGFNEDLVIEANTIPPQIDVPPLPFNMAYKDIEDVKYYEKPRSKYHK